MMLAPFTICISLFGNVNLKKNENWILRGGTRLLIWNKLAMELYHFVVQKSKCALNRLVFKDASSGEWNEVSAERKAVQNQISKRSDKILANNAHTLAISFSLLQLTHTQSQKIYHSTWFSNSKIINSFIELSLLHSCHTIIPIWVSLTVKATNLLLSI